MAEDGPARVDGSDGSLAERITRGSRLQNITEQCKYGILYALIGMPALH